jgi:hypothetical protein
LIRKHFISRNGFRSPLRSAEVSNPAIGCDIQNNT